MVLLSVEVHFYLSMCTWPVDLNNSTFTRGKNPSVYSIISTCTVKSVYIYMLCPIVISVEQQRWPAYTGLRNGGYYIFTQVLLFCISYQ